MYDVVNQTKPTDSRYTDVAWGSRIPDPDYAMEDDPTDIKTVAGSVSTVDGAKEVIKNALLAIPTLSVTPLLGGR